MYDRSFRDPCTFLSLFFIVSKLLSQRGFSPEITPEVIMPKRSDGLCPALPKGRPLLSL